MVFHQTQQFHRRNPNILDKLYEDWNLLAAEEPFPRIWKNGCNFFYWHRILITSKYRLGFNCKSTNIIKWRTSFWRVWILSLLTSVSTRSKNKIPNDSYKPFKQTTCITDRENTIFKPNSIFSVFSSTLQLFFNAEIFSRIRSSLGNRSLILVYSFNASSSRLAFSSVSAFDWWNVLCKSVLLSLEET